LIDTAAGFSIQFGWRVNLVRGNQKSFTSFIIFGVLAVFFGIGSLASLKAQSQDDLMENLREFEGRAFRVSSQDEHSLPGDSLRIERFYFDRLGQPSVEMTWLKRGNSVKSENFSVLILAGKGEISLSKRSAGFLFSSEWQTEAFRVSAQVILLQRTRKFLAWPLRTQLWTLSCAQALQRGSEAGLWLD
jgi:hypothetical protein